MKTLLIPRAFLLLIPLAFFVYGIVLEAINVQDDAFWTYFVFGFIFVPVTFIPYVFKLTLQPQKVKRIALSSGAMAFSYLVLGIMAKVLHYPGADIMIILFALIFAVGCFPFAAKYLFEKDFNR
jgi:uncharacterized membrane protein